MREQMANPPAPTEPEYIEVLKTDVQDDGSLVTFKFEFAGAVDGATMARFFEDPGSTVRSMIWDKLIQKGWLNGNGELLEKYTGVPEVSPDWKTWSYVYRLTPRKKAPSEV
ncbi:MAG: hypothetical protein AAB790_03490 [Patescibacteria group bacterium]